MPYATTDGRSLYYEAEGHGEPVLCLGDAGLGAWQWGWQHAGLAGPYDLVVSETRGCGRSDPPPEPCSGADLVADAEAVLSAHGVRTAHVVGAGLGGLVALALARDTGRVRSLTLLGTPLDADDYDPEPLFAPPDDPDALRSSLAAALSAGFRETHPDVVDSIVEWRAAEDAARESWARQVAAVDDLALEEPWTVTEPALVVHGEADACCPVEAGRELADALPDGEFEAVADAGHLVHVEASRVVNDRLLGFLEGDAA